jgi:glycosyltransferase involved in cell wall biosynthesis
MNIAVLYDFGINLGGGDFVMLNILEALINAGYEVHLFTTYPQGLSIATRFFGKPTSNIIVRHIKSIPILKHPYTIAFLARVIRMFPSESYDLYIVSDDIPLALADRKGIVYIHYPHAARIRLKKYISIIYRYSAHGKLVWKIHEALFPLFFVTKSKPEKWLLLANSLVTRKHITETFNTSIDEVLLLHPPVQSKTIYSTLMKKGFEKENLIVCVGRFELDKRFTDLLYAFSYVRKKIEDIKLSLIGFRRSESVLRRIIASLGLERSVEVFINADRKTLVNRLLRAKALVHPAPHEPFGIAVVEGMAAGVIPIVRKGVNGPWLEITQKGRYGIGFSNAKELIDAMITALTSYESFNIKSMIDRALQFDEEVFKEKFLSILKSYVK